MDSETVEGAVVHEVARIADVVPVNGATLARTPSELRVDEINSALAPAYAKAATLELTKEESALLTAPFPDGVVEKRPHDGLYYIPHIHISDRLTDIFGPGKWTSIRRREWIEGKELYAECVLIIRGCFVGESIGAMAYQPNNPKTNYSDALEGAQSEALRRMAGKRLKCGSQVWNPAWIREFEARRGKNGPAAAPAGGKTAQGSAAGPNAATRSGQKNAVAEPTPDLDENAADAEAARSEIRNIAQATVAGLEATGYEAAATVALARMRAELTRLCSLYKCTPNMLRASTDDRAAIVALFKRFAAQDWTDELPYTPVAEAAESEDDRAERENAEAEQLAKQIDFAAGPDPNPVEMHDPELPPAQRKRKAATK